MKSVRFAYIIFVLLLIGAIINSIALGIITKNLKTKVMNAEENDMAAAEKEYTQIYEDYKKFELYISLSVNHDDLSNLEISFSEIIGAAKAGDKESLIMIKSRLCDCLRHIERLIGINIDSIF